MFLYSCAVFNSHYGISIGWIAFGIWGEQYMKRALHVSGCSAIHSVKLPIWLLLTFHIPSEHFENYTCIFCTKHRSPETNDTSSEMLLSLGAFQYMAELQLGVEWKEPFL
jgi:hypothetical protein